jgi:hypothetical protein
MGSGAADLPVWTSTRPGPVKVAKACCDGGGRVGARREMIRIEACARQPSAARCARRPRLAILCAMTNQRDVIRATSFGCRVIPALASGPLRVGGVASRGLYLHAGESWTLFLTAEQPRGPLTINLVEAGAWLDAIPAGQEWRVEGQALTLPGGSRLIHLPAERIWLSPEPLGPKDGTAQAFARLRSLYGQLETRGAGIGFVELLGDLVRRPHGGEAESFASPQASQALAILRGLRSGAPESLLSALTPFLGAGRGLTPSGDDLIVGLLLALRRWGSPGRIDLSPGFISQLIETARRRTTRLSASLIECAAGGAADERLLRVADHVWSGSPSGAEALEAVTGWGASSGVDALTGMALSLAGELSS